MKSIRYRLEKIYRTYHMPYFLRIDPLSVVHRFKQDDKIEAVALIAAVLSYGKVEHIIGSINKILVLADNDIPGFINNTTFDHKLRVLRNFKHRFNTGKDIAVLCEAVKLVYIRYGSLQKMFLQVNDIQLDSMKRAMESFISVLKSFASKLNKKHEGNFDYLLPSPSKGSCCKRLNMFFRWMVRADDGIDLGIWRKVSPAILIVPLDTHLLRVSRMFGFTSRKTADWKTAEDITAHLRKIDPYDPVRFDFSLCRFGMLGNRK